MRYVYSFVCSLAFCSLGLAQNQTVLGELTSDQARDFAELTVELHPVNGRGESLDRTFVSPDGRFQVRNVSPGSYLVVVKDRQGSVVHQEYGNTQGFGGLSVRLPEEKRGERPVAGLVSIDELRHTPPKAARKAFDEALRKSGKGDATASLALLEQAVRLDPEFLQALNNLGSQYLRESRYQEAAQCFRRAAALGPRTPLVHANLAQALLFLRDFAGAEASARTAIRLNATDAVAPRAQLALGLALAGQGDLTQARNLMVTCTHSPDTVVRRAAEGFLARLR